MVSVITEPRYSVVVPVYGNRDTLAPLLTRLGEVAERLPGTLEVVCVVDGSPDDSHQVLLELGSSSPVTLQVLSHSRNFGSFAAIRTGLAHARGRYIGVMAADLQEPPELMEQFFATLASDDIDVVVGRRLARDDPGLTRGLSAAYWKMYRRFVVPDLPPGGVDVFAVTRKVVPHLLDLRESHSSLVALLYWIGFRRAEVGYSRLAREHGKSGWTFRKKWSYLSDSIFAFTALPIRVLTAMGTFGTVILAAVAFVVLVARATGKIRVPGYTALMLVMLLCTFMLLLGLGIVGSYVWRVFENTKGRPNSIVASQRVFSPTEPPKK